MARGTVICPFFVIFACFSNVQPQIPYFNGNPDSYDATFAATSFGISVRS
jgi:hypothetical protein